MSFLNWPLSHLDDHRFAGLRVLFVMAAEAEYGEHLRSLINPLFIGIGPIEATLNTATALQALSFADKRPDLVVSLGSAGSKNLKQGEIYQVSHVSWRDMDASALGVPKGVTPFLNLPAEISLPTPLEDMQKARLSTGSNIVSGEAYDHIKADMVDMETFAVYRTCLRFAVPMIGFRGISDGAEELQQYHDWTRLLPIIDERLADALKSLETLFLQAGGLPDTMLSG